MPAAEQDSVFVFCSDVPDGGSLTAPSGATCTYQWMIYDEVNQLLIQKKNEITNLNTKSPNELNSKKVTANQQFEQEKTMLR